MSALHHYAHASPSSSAGLGQPSESALPQLTEFEKRMEQALEDRRQANKDMASGVAPRVVDKRPAAAGPPRSKAKMMRPAAAPAKQPALPSSHGAVQYRTEKIYVNFELRSFRIINDPSESRSDYKVHWKAGRPTMEEWQRALSRINAYCDGE